MRKLLIEWKHFYKGGKTCKRCFLTGVNLDQAIKQINREYKTKGIEILFQETKLPENRMSESNQILINRVPIENLLSDIKTGENFCDSCSDLIDDPAGCNCRTLIQADKIYEEIPADFLKKAIINFLNQERKTMKIQVLGSGCTACRKLFELTKQAVKQLKLDEKVEYITDISKIIEMGVMTSPVLAVDGKPVMAGSSADIEKIKSLLVKDNDCACVKKSACCCGDKCC